MTGWQNKPFQVQAKEGEIIAFCMCGKSLNGPFCDGNHKGSGIGPKVITFEKDTALHACGCQQSNARPMCDDTHKSISE